MWLSGQQKRPADNGEGQSGIVTMNGGELAVLLDSERRGLELYAPAGYHWTPRVGQRVLVIQGKGEIPCVVGAREDGDVPDRVGIEAGRLTLEGDEVTVRAADDAVVRAGNVRLEGQVYIKEETIEELIRRIVIMILLGG